MKQTLSDGGNQTQTPKNSAEMVEKKMIHYTN